MSKIGAPSEISCKLIHFTHKCLLLILCLRTPYEQFFWVFWNVVVTSLLYSWGRYIMQIFQVRVLLLKISIYYWKFPSIVGTITGKMSGSQNCYPTCCVEAKGCYIVFDASCCDSSVCLFFWLTRATCHRLASVLFSYQRSNMAGSLPLI